MRFKFHVYWNDVKCINEFCCGFFASAHNCAHNVSSWGWKARWNDVSISKTWQKSKLRLLNYLVCLCIERETGFYCCPSKVKYDLCDTPVMNMFKIKTFKAGKSTDLCPSFPLALKRMWAKPHRSNSANCGQGICAIPCIHECCYFPSREEADIVVWCTIYII